jgi:hypothetical protein
MNGRRSLLASLSRPAVIALAIAGAGCHRATPAERSAEPIAEKNAAARGGLQAWRAVNSMSLAGNLEAGRPFSQARLAESYRRPRGQLKVEARKAAANPRLAEADKPVLLPFVMELERPRKTRVEIRFQGKTAVQVFDGSSGWKLRPFLGRREVEPYTAEELQLASLQTDLDGPLIDYEKKGSRVELEGNEPVAGRDAYRLKVTSSSGQVRTVWVDAQTYLEVKIDGGTRRLDGKLHPVWTYFRDYKQVNGLLIPHLLETTVDGVPGSERIMVERVALNPQLADARFGKPN